MADNTRSGEGGNREHAGHNPQQNGRNRNQAPEGFEGMNYEQQRGPYRGGRSNMTNRRNGEEGRGSSGRGREES